MVYNILLYSGVEGGKTLLCRKQGLQYFTISWGGGWLGPLWRKQGLQYSTLQYPGDEGGCDPPLEDTGFRIFYYILGRRVVVTLPWMKQGLKYSTKS